MKKSTKKIKPAFIVNLTDFENPADVYYRFGIAKQNAKLPMTDNEFSGVINKIVDLATIMLIAKQTLCSNCVKVEDGEKLIFDSKGNYTVKKPNIFRRFWNWITRKK